MPSSPSPTRDYCYFLDHRKYNRNRGCRRHDNLYGINGGGGERDRWSADRELFSHMRGADLGRVRGVRLVLLQLPSGTLGVAGPARPPLREGAWVTAFLHADHTRMPDRAPVFTRHR